ncbi:MAG: hypothetical protein GQ555_04380 [Desulfobacterales bacterium]|nr:hypothetical protein [Desulfobacterales bacterium]
MGKKKLFVCKRWGFFQGHVFLAQNPIPVTEFEGFLGSFRLKGVVWSKIIPGQVV